MAGSCCTAASSSTAKAWSARSIISFDRIVAIWLTRFLSGLLILLLFMASLLPFLVLGGVSVAAGLDLEADPIPLYLVGGAALLLLLPTMVYVGLGTWLAPWFVVYDCSGAWTGLLQSWDAARGNRATLFVFLAAQTLVGLAALMIGILFCS